MPWLSIKYRRGERRVDSAVKWTHEHRGKNSMKETERERVKEREKEICRIALSENLFLNE